MTQTSVVILNYNGREWLQKFLPSVIRFSPDVRIVVADNDSSDGSAGVVRKEFPDVELITIPQNLGFAGGYNFVLKKVISTYFVLLNSDIEVSEGWLEPLVRLLEANSTIAAVQPKIISYHGRQQFEYAGAGGGFIDALGYPFCRGRIFDSLEEDHGQYNDTRPVFWASGACLFIRAAAYHAMGGLDENFFAHMEEIDLCWKLRRAGLEVYYSGESKVYHVGGGTLSKLNPQKTYLNFRNGLVLIFKHQRGAELLWKLPLRVLLDWLAAGMFLSQGSWGDAGAVLRAHAHFLEGLYRNYKKRKALQNFLSTYRVKYIYPQSIVMDYFLLGKKKFTDLRF